MFEVATKQYNFFTLFPNCRQHAQEGPGRDHALETFSVIIIPPVLGQYVFKYLFIQNFTFLGCKLLDIYFLSSVSSVILPHVVCFLNHLRSSFLILSQHTQFLCLFLKSSSLMLFISSVSYSGLQYISLSSFLEKKTIIA